LDSIFTHTHTHNIQLLFGKPGEPRHTWQNIKPDLKEVGCGLDSSGLGCL